MPALSSLEMLQARRVKRFLQVFSWASERLGLDVPPIVNLEDLRSQPPASLGYAWAQHLDNNGLNPLDKGLRRQQLHDGLHVLTGYRTDLLGEAQVQAFLVGAKFRPIHVLILLGSLGALKRQQRQGITSLSPAAVRSHLAA
ncbi:MAG: Coq4 family protein, partial [Cyanobacteria bacterium J06632_3]